MYIPNAYKEENLETLVAFMRANSFATLVSVVDGAPFASHIPIIVGFVDGYVTLSGHVAKQNPHWRAFAQGESLAIFTGPHAYISPSHYDKHESVPTWNYIAVHAYGAPEILTLDRTREQMHAMIDRMIATYEASYQAHWDDLSEKFRNGMLQGIVGFEMRVSRIEGKYKLSQNRSEAEQVRVAHALIESPDAAEAQTGHAMLAGMARPDEPR
jgi:transcriptional regulator